MTDGRDLSKPSKAPEDIVLEHFGRCWRGECTLLITFLTGTAAWMLFVLLLSWLESVVQFQWSAEARFAIVMLRLIGSIPLATWLGVGLLRSSLRNYLLGRRFWPIVAGIYGGMCIIGAIWGAWSVIAIAWTLLSR